MQTGDNNPLKKYTEGLKESGKRLYAHHVLSLAHAGDIPYSRLVERIDKETIGQLAEKGNMYYVLAYVSCLAQSEQSWEQQNASYWLFYAQSRFCDQINNERVKTAGIWERFLRASVQMRVLAAVRRLADDLDDAQAMYSLGSFVSLFGFDPNQSDQDRKECMDCSINYLTKALESPALPLSDQSRVKRLIDEIRAEQEEKEQSLIDIFTLGKEYYEGTVKQKNYALALENLQKVADASSQDNEEKELVAQAACLVGNLFAQGRTTGNKKKKKVVIARDFQKAHTYYDKAIRLGNYNALYDLGMLHYKNKQYKNAGDAFTQVIEKSKDAKKRACSHWCLGMMHLLGQSAQKNEAAALDAFKKAQESAGILQSFDQFSAITDGEIFDFFDRYIPKLLGKNPVEPHDFVWCYFAGRLCCEGQDARAQKRRKQAVTWLKHAADTGRDVCAQWFLAKLSDDDDVSLLDTWNYLKKVSESKHKEYKAIQDDARAQLMVYAKKGYVWPLWYTIQSCEPKLLSRLLKKFKGVTLQMVEHENDYLLLTEIKDSAGYYDELARIAKDNPVIAFFLGKLHVEHSNQEKDDNEAIKYLSEGTAFLKQAYTYQQKNEEIELYIAKYLDYLGWTHVKNNQYDAADKALDEAIQLGSIMAKAHKGLLYFRVKDAEKAKTGLRLLEEAALCNNGFALRSLGLHYFGMAIGEKRFNNPKPYFEKAESLLEKAKKYEDPEAESLLQSLQECKNEFVLQGKRNKNGASIQSNAPNHTTVKQKDSKAGDKNTAEPTKDDKQIALCIRLSTVRYFGHGERPDLHAAVTMLQRALSTAGLSYEYKKMIGQIDGEQWQVLEKMIGDVIQIAEPSQEHLDALYVIGRLYCEEQKDEVKGVTCIQYAAEQKHRPSRYYLAANLELQSVKSSDKFDYLFDLLDEDIDDEVRKKGLEILKEYAVNGFLGPQCYTTIMFEQMGELPVWLDAMSNMPHDPACLAFCAWGNSKPLQLLRRNGIYDKIKTYADKDNAAACLLLARALISAHGTEIRSNQLLPADLGYFKTGYEQLPEERKKIWSQYYAEVLTEQGSCYFHEGKYQESADCLDNAKNLGYISAQALRYVFLSQFFLKNNYELPHHFRDLPEFKPFQTPKQIHEYLIHRLEEIVQCNGEEIKSRSIIIPCLLALGNHYFNSGDLDKAARFYSAAVEKGSKEADECLKATRYLQSTRRGERTKNSRATSRKKTVASVKQEKKNSKEQGQVPLFCGALGYLQEQKFDEAYNLLHDLAQQNYFDANVVLVDMFLSEYEKITLDQVCQYFEQAMILYVRLRIYGEHVENPAFIAMLNRLLQLKEQDSDPEKKKIAQRLLALAEKHNINLKCVEMP